MDIDTIAILGGAAIAVLTISLIVIFGRRIGVSRRAHAGGAAAASGAVVFSGDGGACDGGGGAGCS